MTDDSVNWEQFFCGFYDCDGSMSISLVNRNKKKKRDLNIPIGFEIKFTFSQAAYNFGIVDLLEKQLNITLPGRSRNRNRKGTPTNQADTSIFYTSPIGGILVNLLKNNKPINPRMLNDFLVADKLNELLSQKVQSSKKGLISLIYLAYQTSNQQKINSATTKKKPIEYFFSVVFPNFKNEPDYWAGIEEGKSIYHKIREIVIKHDDTLRDITLFSDYMLGAHCGDGGLTVILSWTPKQYLNRPVWTITDPSENYLYAFKNTMGTGRVARVGKNYSSFQYVLQGIKQGWDIVIPFFHNKPLPPYKLNQYQIFCSAVKLLKDKEHLTLSGGLKLLNLVYNMSENSHRTHSKQNLEHKLRQYFKEKKNKKKTKI